MASYLVKMLQFAQRHWTGLLLVILLAGWGLFYLPSTPTFAVFELKMAIDARDGDRAVQFVNFQSVARHAATAMVEKQVSPDDAVAALLGKGAAQLLSAPVASVAETWARRQVDQGARDVQLPAAAVLGAIVLLHRQGNSADTQFRDRKGQLWQIRMACDEAGRWQIVEVKNIQQLLARLEQAPGAPPAAP